jgi:hypothetical protein
VGLTPFERFTTNSFESRTSQRFPMLPLVQFFFKG